MRGGRQKGSKALAEDLAVVGRVDWTDTPGLLVGGSSGTAVVAAVRTAAKNPPGPVVVLLADGWDRYRSKPWMQGLGEPGGSAQRPSKKGSTGSKGDSQHLGSPVLGT